VESGREVEAALVIPFLSAAPPAGIKAVFVAVLVFMGRRKFNNGVRAMVKRQLTAGVLVFCVLALAGCQDRPGVTVRKDVVGTAKEGDRLGGNAGVEYVTGVVTLHEGDAITVHVLNYSGHEQQCQIEIFRDTRSGANLVSDNEAFTVKSRRVASCRYAVKTAGEYWVLIKGERHPLAPEAIFGGGKSGDKPADDASPAVVFKPGDFLKVEATAYPAYGRGTEREILRTTEKASEKVKDTRKE
jgi:hypothetical protein